MKISIGSFQKIYDPSIGEESSWYINDHTLIHGRDGWHMFGITHAEPCDPLNEVLCAHAVGASLQDTAWRKLPYPLAADRSRGEQHFWAPHVIFADGLYYMFWCAGSTVSHDQYQIMMATSPDLYEWTRCDNVNPIIVDGYDARDPMVLRVDDKWILYYTCNETPQGGHHQVACVESVDLKHWSNKRVVFEDETTGTYAGPTESPFVVPYGGKYYLFIGPRDGQYNKTAVLESEDPFRFTIDRKIADFPAHAAEVVRDEDGQYYLTRCGWKQGGLFIAPLYFEKE